MAADFAPGARGPRTTLYLEAITNSICPNPKKSNPRHPKIKQLMDPYLKRYNNYVNLSDILTASGKRMTNLPTLPQYCSAKGDSFIC